MLPKIYSNKMNKRFNSVARGFVCGAMLCGVSIAAYAEVGVSPSGAATYSMGIAIPSGVAGLEPSITLGYNSQGGVGLLGQGWSIGGLSSITRCIKTKLQDGSDFQHGLDRPILDQNGNGTTSAADNSSSTTDGFCLDGQRLIKNDANPGIANGQYRLEREAFSRITYSSSSDQWTVETKTGSIMTYGGSSNTVSAGANSVSRNWLLNTVSDRKNNAITFTYQTPTTADRRIDHIAYGPNGQNTVQFIYESRPDQYESWLNGIRNFNDQRLRMIQVGTKSAFTNNTTWEIRRYLLSYITSPTTSRSLVSTIQNCVPASGYEAQMWTTNSSNAKLAGQQKCLPPVRFSYGAGSLSTTQVNAPEFSDSLGYNSSNFYSTFQLADVNNDGHPDICLFSVNHNLSCYLASVDGSGNISWSAANWTAQTDSVFSTAGSYVHLQYIDMDKDGKLDVCSRFSTGVRCYLNSGSGFNKTTAGGGNYITGPSWTDSAGWNNSKYASSVVFIDINNDEYPDVCGRFSSGVQCYLNQKDGTFAYSTSYSISSLTDSAFQATYTDTSNNTQYKVQTYSTLQFIDINHDGYADVCAFLPDKTVTNYLNSNFNQYCWLNTTGNLFSNQAISTGLKIGRSTSYNVDFGTTADSDGYVSLDINPATFIDINSDSIPDYCIRATNGINCWINQQYSNGNPHMVGTSISGLTNAFADSAGWHYDKYSSTIQFVDINGDNRPDICGRGINGIWCLLNISVAAGFQVANSGFSNVFSDNDGFYDPSLYKTFRYFTMANGHTALFSRQKTGASSVYYMGSLALNDQQSDDKVISLQAGVIPATNISYRNGAITSGVYQKGNWGGLNAVSYATTYSPSLSAFDLPAAMPLVTQISTTDPSTGQVSSTAYSYQGLVGQARRGSLGFRTVSSTSLPSESWTQTTYHQDWPYTGMPDTVVSGNANKSSDTTNGWLTKTQYSYAAIDLKNGTNTTSDTAPSSACNKVPASLALLPSHLGAQLTNTNYFVYPYRTVTTTRSVNTLTALTTITADTVMETTQGNTLCAGTETDAYDPILNGNRSWYKVVFNTYDTNSIWTSNGQWILGRLIKTQVEDYAPDSSFASVVTQQNQGGYSIVFNPNTQDGSLGPSNSNIMPWFIPIMTNLLN